MPQFINIFELARRGETIEGEVAVKDLPNFCLLYTSCAP